ncbi:imidazolonepropionase [Inhella gelatinilytica]|uniref:Imidazolonepropionase n=1 Tax=Inhella gelatinilytica TaxID=2795030 RepID=A0A931IUT1_9BURK|nr:imidazolonepropionase [Inhella gelatinilytica]MBH9552549.1 imidazolonepropionase [Inhella gelatinilytica]
MKELTLWREARLATLSGHEPWGAIEDGALLTQGEQITWVGRLSELPRDAAVAQEHSLHGAWVTPGLIDAHTHLVYGGLRAHEFELRLEGASYEAIARAGGGIRSTVAHTRAASEDALLAPAAKRLAALKAEGLTTIEIKSGYGLSREHEAKMLRVARRLAGQGVQVRTTYLGLHAIPPEFEGRADDYVAACCDDLPSLHAEGLVDAVDAFCENIGFTPAQVERVFQQARALGLPVKLHAEQLSDQGGSQLTARFGGLSADHLEWLSAEGVASMAAAGTVAMLLPGAYHCLRETKLPPIPLLRDAGVPMALSTDHNPGTSPVLSLLAVMQLACIHFRMTPEEALRGLTLHAARALGLSDRGQLLAGQRADFCVWDVDHPRELSYWLGGRPLINRVFGGVPDRELA